jgi:hypothetical protein
LEDKVRTFGTTTALVLLVSAFGQSPTASTARPDPFFAELKARHLAEIKQELARKGIVRSTERPLLSDVALVYNPLKPFLPAGRLTAYKFKDPTRFSSVQIETPLDETANYRFLRVWDVSIERWGDAEAAEDRLAELLCVPAVFKPGAPQGTAPGQLCYRYRTSEIFIRENVTVAIHCSGPIPLRKTPLGGGEDPRYVIPDRSSAPDLCAELTSDLGLRIDGLIRDHLGQAPTQKNLR